MADDLSIHPADHTDPRHREKLLDRYIGPWQQLYWWPSYARYRIEFGTHFFYMEKFYRRVEVFIGQGQSVHARRVTLLGRMSTGRDRSLGTTYIDALPPGSSIDERAIAWAENKICLGHELLEEDGI